MRRKAKPCAPFPQKLAIGFLEIPGQKAFADKVEQDRKACSQSVTGCLKLPVIEPDVSGKERKVFALQPVLLAIEGQGQFLGIVLSEITRRVERRS